MCVSSEDIQVIFSLQINERGFPGNDRAVCLLLFWLGAFRRETAVSPADFALYFLTWSGKYSASTVKSNKQSMGWPGTDLLYKE